MAAGVGADGIDGGGLQIDVPEAGLYSAARNGDDRLSITFSHAAGPMSSALEHAIFEIAYDITAVSTVDLIDRALASDGTVARIDADNAASVVPTIDAPPFVRDLLAGAAAEGFTVHAPTERSVVNGWSGNGWAQLRDDGAFGFLLAGGLRGGATTQTNPLFDSLVGAAKEQRLDTVESSSRITAKTAGQIAKRALVFVQAPLDAVDTALQVEAAGGSKLEAFGTGVAQATVDVITTAAAAAVVTAVATAAGPGIVGVALTVATLVAAVHVADAVSGAYKDLAVAKAG